MFHRFLYIILYYIIAICIYDDFRQSVIIIGSTSLEVLGFSHNQIGDDGMSLISSELQYNIVLKSLRVAGCGLSVKGTLACKYLC